MFHTHVVSVCYKCFICFRHMLRSSVSCFSGMFRESLGHAPSAVGRDASSGGSTGGAHDASGVLRMGRTRPYLGSRVLPQAEREMRGSGEGATGAGHCKSNRGRVHLRGGTDGPFC